MRAGFADKLRPPAIARVPIVALALVLLISLAGDRSASAAEVAHVAIEPSKAQRQISLRDRLIVGLQARLTTEVAFIDTVVMKVHNGKISQRVVDETFFWARQRAGVSGAAVVRVRRPIIYFQPAMIARAKLLHVSL